jgi:hypothetical protein
MDSNPLNLPKPINNNLWASKWPRGNNKFIWCTNDEQTFSHYSTITIVNHIQQVLFVELH